MARKKKSQPLPPWVWLFTGVVTGLFLAFLYHLASIKTTPPKPQSRTVEKAKPAPRGSKSTQYDFYTLLPDKEVVDATTPRSKTTPKSDGKPDTFLIQTGSFRSAQDADRRRAELILLGLDVQVQAVELGGEIWHRVQIGPLDSEAKLDATKTTLSENKVEYIVTRLK